jgi:hypothetical protein
MPGHSNQGECQPRGYTAGTGTGKAAPEANRLAKWGEEVNGTGRERPFTVRREELKLEHPHNDLGNSC